jgi:hypothetical protein
MEFKVRGKLYTTETALEAILKILTDECKNGKIKMTQVKPRGLPFWINSQFTGLIYLLEANKPTGYIVIDKDNLKVIFYNIEGKKTDTMTFADYLIDTEYNR